MHELHVKDGYQKLQTQFTQIVELIQTSRSRIFQAVNTKLINLYWKVGNYISLQLEKASWGETSMSKHSQTGLNIAHTSFITIKKQTEFINTNETIKQNINNYILMKKRLANLRFILKNIIQKSKDLNLEACTE